MTPTVKILTNHPHSGYESLIMSRLMHKLPADEFEVTQVMPLEGRVLVMDDFDSFLTRDVLGKFIPIQKARGYVYKMGHCTVMPTFGPELLKGRMNYIPMVRWDLKRIKGIELPRFPYEELVLFPTAPDFNDFLSGAGDSPLMVDLETVDSFGEDEENKKGTVICRASLAYSKKDVRRAITFPWNEPYVSIFQNTMSGRADKVFWNGYGFDWQRLREHGIPMNGKLIDAMELWHWLHPTLPKSLGSVTTLHCNVPEWKSLSSDKPELYSAMDAWATSVNYDAIVKALQAKGKLELADRHVTMFLPVLQAMSDRGVLRDKDKANELGAVSDAKMAVLEEGFNSNPDLHKIRNLHPKQKDGTCGYVKTPKDTSGMELLSYIIPQTGETVERWTKRLPFVPSSQQVQRYYDLKGYKADATDESSLKRLYFKHKDPLLLDFLAYRGEQKIKGTYVGEDNGSGEYIYKFEGPDGRIHTKYTLKPTTARLSSMQPNLQNWPEEAKGMLKAKPGHKLIDVDLSSVEAFLTGYFAGDQEYMRRSMLGIHKLAMKQYLGDTPDFSLSDAELKKFVKGVKELDPKLYRQIKVVIYGGNYLAGARTVYRNNPEDFKSEAEAKKFLKFCQSLSNKIGAWQKSTIARAQLNHKLENPFGYECEFWDLPGGDGPACVAFMPQSTVACIMREIMVQLFYNYEAGKYMILQVHDSLVFEVPDELVDSVGAEIRTVMTQPWPQLNGLSMACDIKVGSHLNFGD